MRGRGGYRRDLQQSLTLLRVFLLASAAILVAGGALLGWALTRTLHQQALASERWALVRYVDGVVRPALVHGNWVVVSRTENEQMLDSLASQTDIVTVKVWKPDGTLAWTNRDTGRIGRRFPLDDSLETALRHNRPTAEFVKTDGDEEENAAERSLGFSSLLEVYAPIMGADRTKVIGAYEIYADPSSLDRLIGSRRRMIWTALAVVFVGLWAVLAVLVRRASRLLRRQNEKLRVRSARLLEANRLLEASALEAVESLNATVDAKDPYTAGHSQRVQRIALALGEELGLPPERLDALRFAGLFHDIGKIAVPDAVLLKPGPLDEEEFELIKRHPEDGARIVARLHRLEAAVPVIRHHHERWDGRGYPDRLRGDEIPVEAAVVGLADAWDAMTTDRPYSAARPVDDAVAEIERGRGSQFAPSVVDAFLRVLRGRPDVLEPEPALRDALLV
ncbi:MAG TPA: HD-GYP domain-containing protein [Gaiellaceae bacterium]|nr:HD-GYP domain-containing protein [Gaiellaceae bacterium]